MGKIFPFREVRRGDIIVFRYPLDPNLDYVKRVIGLPGETVEIRDKRLFINGKLLDEPYTLFQDPTIYPNDPGLPEQYRMRDQMDARVVPPDSYFAMGDNRDLSADSRYWGFVPRAHIEGRPFFVYWSFNGHGNEGSDKMPDLVYVARHFLDKTRWDRTFFIVDSKYHYHEE
jgi:signal peptidase I